MSKLILVKLSHLIPKKVSKLVYLNVEGLCEMNLCLQSAYELKTFSKLKQNSGGGVLPYK